MCATPTATKRTRAVDMGGAPKAATAAAMGIFRMRRAVSARRITTGLLAKSSANSFDIEISNPSSPV